MEEPNIEIAVKKLTAAIKEYPNYPIEGVVFKDMMPALAQPETCNSIIDALFEQWKNESIQVVCGIESRGFFFGLPLALKLGVPFVPIRKMGKLPGKTIEISYDLEYGSACIEVQAQSLPPNANVLIHDDLLATGGTALAAAHLVQIAGAKVAGFSFLLNLEALQGKNRLDAIAQNTKYLIDC